MVCDIEIIYGGDLGYLAPKIVIECPEHGCLKEGGLGAGTFGDDGSEDTGDDDRVVTAIKLDECGHVCKIYFEDDDVCCTGHSI
jgi:hypothetical protein